MFYYKTTILGYPPILGKPHMYPNSLWQTINVFFFVMSCAKTYSIKIEPKPPSRADPGVWSFWSRASPPKKDPETCGFSTWCHGWNSFYWTKATNHQAGGGYNALCIGLALDNLLPWDTSTNINTIASNMEEIRKNHGILAIPPKMWETLVDSFWLKLNIWVSRHGLPGYRPYDLPIFH